MLSTDERTCEQCGEVLVRREGTERVHAFARRRFCSHACRNKARKLVPPRTTCATCGVDLPKGFKQHCSKACREGEPMVLTKPCDECGEEFRRNPTDSRRTFEGRRFCSPSCSGKYGRRLSWEQGQGRRDYIIGEVEFLVGTDSMESLSQRLGFKPDTLAEILTTWGRPDLAERLRATSFDRARPCPDCTRLVKPSHLEEHRATTCRGVG